jgi:uncharacterized protein YigE (DUF2233 family)
MKSQSGRRQSSLLIPLSVTLVSLASAGFGQTMSLDVSAVKPGAITVKPATSSVSIHWQDENSNPWEAVFSLEPRQPLISSISVAGKSVIQRAQGVHESDMAIRGPEK